MMSKIKIIKQLDKNIYVIVAITLLLKIVYFLVAYLIAHYSTINFFEAALLKNNSIFSSISIFGRWDTGWYKYIAENGHSRIPSWALGPNPYTGWQQSYYGFFPLYPFTIRAIMQLLHLNFFSAAFIFSLCITPACFLAFYKLIKLMTTNKQIAVHSTIFLMVLPFNFYYSMFLSESYFLFLILVLFISIHTKKYIWILPAGFLITLIRPNGIITAFPLFIYFLQQEGVFTKKNFSKNFIKQNYKTFSRLLYFFIFPVTLLLYCFYLKYMTGDFFAYITAQRTGWEHKFVFPLKALFAKGDFYYQFFSFYAIAFIIFLFFIIKKLPISLNTYNWINVLFPLTTGNVWSVPRYYSLLFPINIILARWSIKYNLLIQICIYSILFAVHLYLFYLWLIGDRLII